MINSDALRTAGKERIAIVLRAISRATQQSFESKYSTSKEKKISTYTKMIFCQETWTKYMQNSSFNSCEGKTVSLKKKSHCRAKKCQEKGKMRANKGSERNQIHKKNLLVSASPSFCYCWNSFFGFTLQFLFQTWKV